VLDSGVFCPLCKAEFREGFTQCNDCKLDLVERKAAEFTKVVCVWKGGNPSSADKIVGRLADAGIPCRMVTGFRRPEFSVWTFLTGYGPQLTVELFVLGSDAERASRIVS
jgi:hypothetical protein